MVPSRHQMKDIDLDKKSVPYIFTWPWTIEQTLPKGAQSLPQVDMYWSVEDVMKMYLFVCVSA